VISHRRARPLPEAAILHVGEGLADGIHKGAVSDHPNVMLRRETQELAGTLAVFDVTLQGQAASYTTDNEPPTAPPEPETPLRLCVGHT